MQNGVLFRTVQKESENYRIEDNVHAPVHLHALVRRVAVHGIIEAPVFDGDLMLWYLAVQ